MTGKWMEGREMVCGELREIVKNAIAQDVYKVSLQFQKFITEANEEADKWKLLQNETYIFMFFLPHLVTP